MADAETVRKQMQIMRKIEREEVGSHILVFFY